MDHPHGEWTRTRLEAYVGTTETLTLEYKGMRSLLSSDKVERNRRIEEAAKDVAAMANEQGGVIVYGVAEDKIEGTSFTRAARIEDGFTAQDNVNREWFLQFARDRIHPPLTTLDAVHVPLDESGSRFALVVLVPQARGIARQTDDNLFWRRDAQGSRPMSVQQIEDVRARTLSPVLDLLVGRSNAVATDGHRVMGMTCRLDIANTSGVTAQFAVITLGLYATALTSGPEIRDYNSEWRPIHGVEKWAVSRYVFASGSTRFWSPLTPGFTATTPEITLETLYPPLSSSVETKDIGIVRLDHDGGSRVYTVTYGTLWEDRPSVRIFPTDRSGSDFPRGVTVPSIFAGGAT